MIHACSESRVRIGVPHWPAVLGENTLFRPLVSCRPTIPLLLIHWLKADWRTGTPQNREIDVFWRLIANTVDRLIGCLEGQRADDLNWTPLEDANSLYVLATHTMGNIRQNVLGGLCDVPVQRDRDAEFQVTGDSPEEIKARWNELRDQISDCVLHVPEDRLDRAKEHPGRGAISDRETLIVAARHAAEHFGQAQLTRDLLLRSLVEE